MGKAEVMGRGLAGSGLRVCWPLSEDQADTKVSEPNRGGRGGGGVASA